MLPKNSFPNLVKLEKIRLDFTPAKLKGLQTITGDEETIKFIPGKPRRPHYSCAVHSLWIWTGLVTTSHHQCNNRNHLDRKRTLSLSGTLDKFAKIRE